MIKPYVRVNDLERTAKAMPQTYNHLQFSHRPNLHNKAWKKNMNQTASNSNVESTSTQTTNRSNDEPKIIIHQHPSMIQLQNLCETQIMKEPRISVA